MTKRKMIVPIHTRPGGRLMSSVEVVGTVGELTRLTLKLTVNVAVWHGVGEPQVQSAKEFMRRHPELKMPVAVL